MATGSLLGDVPLIGVAGTNGEGNRTNPSGAAWGEAFTGESGKQFYRGVRPNIRVKARRPTEFGHKVLFAEAEHGIVSTY